mmetsp:Transcript_13238/g.21518  ORF Transcript_13238/g.21518 Transcript_13238/m.21518 type:complete len:223 (+) Transcript_13238:660-1328(+)
MFVLVRVDPHDVSGDVVTLGGGGDDDLLGARGDVLGGTGSVNEDAGALDNELHTQLLPRQLGWVTVGHDLDDLPVDGDVRVIHDLHVRGESATDGVVLDEVRSLLHAARVVDGDNLKVRRGAPMPASQEVAANSAESVEGHLYLRFGDGVDGGSLDSLATLEARGRTAELNLEGGSGSGEGSHCTRCGGWTGARNGGFGAGIAGLSPFPVKALKYISRSRVC